MRPRPAPANDPERPSVASRLSIEAVHGTRVYEGVIEQLQLLVINGKLQPGDKLPSERELSQMFQVGRSSVRDAIRHLETLGVVRSRHGGGTVVQDLSPASIVTPLATMLTRRRGLVQELLDVRAIIEPALAYRAARNASEDDLARLRAVVKRQERRLQAGELSIREDSEFHGIIARAAGNRVMLSVLDVLLDLLAETRSLALQGRGRTVRSAGAHRKILLALERRAPEAAQRAMQAHIAGIRDSVERKLRAPPIRPARAATRRRRRAPRRA